MSSNSQATVDSTKIEPKEISFDKKDPSNVRDYIKWHGQQYRKHNFWSLPKCICETAAEARPGYSYSSNASEYLESDEETLMSKLRVAAAMIRKGQKNKCNVIYSGAGLSTAAGIPDYATKASDSIVSKMRNDAISNATVKSGTNEASSGSSSTVTGNTRATSKPSHRTSSSSTPGGNGSGKNKLGKLILATHQKLNLQPTLGHHALALLSKKDKIPIGNKATDTQFFHHWVNQNHDRLAQKAGYPPNEINEIHGGWSDTKNPVVKMSGVLRTDLFDWMEEWSEKLVNDEDGVVLCVGTSLSGMAADDYIPKEAAKSGKESTLIIIGLQPTRMDSDAGIKIWGKLDDVLCKLAKVLLSEESDNSDLNVQIPDPECWKIGQQWQKLHPSCSMATPMRPGYKDETPTQILKRSNPAEYKKRHGNGKTK